MNFYRLFTLAIIVVLTFSCEEDETFPKKFTPNSYEIKSFGIFTNKGEITDKEQVDNILKRKRIEFKKMFDEELFTEELKIDNNFYLNYLNNNEVEIVTNTQKEVRKIISLNGIDYLEKNEIVTYHMGQTPFINIYKYKPLYIKNLAMPGGNIIETKPCFYSKKNANEVILPFIESFIFNNNSSNYSKTNNDFNNKGIFKLGDNDTLIVRTLDLILK